MVSKQKINFVFKISQISCYECQLVCVKVQIIIYVLVLEIEQTTQKNSTRRYVTTDYKTIGPGDHFGARFVQIGNKFTELEANRLSIKMNDFY